MAARGHGGPGRGRAEAERKTEEQNQKESGGRWGGVRGRAGLAVASPRSPRAEGAPPRPRAWCPWPPGVCGAWPRLPLSGEAASRPAALGRVEAAVGCPGSTEWCLVGVRPSWKNSVCAPKPVPCAGLSAGLFSAVDLFV